jgi:hypothetical protein
LLAPLVEKELSYGLIFCQSDGPVVGLLRLMAVPKSLQEVSADGPVRLIGRHGCGINRVQHCKAPCWSIRLCYCSGVCSLPADSR